MTFEINPYVGPLPLRLGMTQDQVAEVLGQPQVVSKNRLGEPTHNFDFCAVGYDKDTLSANYFGFTPGGSVAYKGVSLFNNPNALRFMLEEDGEPIEFVGFILLLKLGVSLSGFHDNDQSQLAVNMFERGRFEKYRSQFKPFQTATP